MRGAPLPLLLTHTWHGNISRPDSSPSSQLQMLSLPLLDLAYSWHLSSQPPCLVQIPPLWPALLHPVVSLIHPCSTPAPASQALVRAPDFLPSWEEEFRLAVGIVWNNLTSEKLAIWSGAMCLQREDLAESLRCQASRMHHGGSAWERRIQMTARQGKWTVLAWQVILKVRWNSIWEFKFENLNTRAGPRQRRKTKEPAVSKHFPKGLLFEYSL